ncbi:hypothetical protein ACIQPQ_24465 [Streptomyces sp. NPDC091281]|uniref:hypothetical protein n=1 Tax=Streptomyces sp. NPDC091281 TaxID=3365985 RepID=UPI0037F2117B
MIIVALADPESLAPPPLDATQLDRTVGRRLTRHVKRPMPAPVPSIVLTLRVIDSVQTFAIINAMAKGGPGTSTLAISNYVHQLGFQTFDIGHATAIGLLASLAMPILLVRNSWSPPARTTPTSPDIGTPQTRATAR